MINSTTVQPIKRGEVYYVNSHNSSVGSEQRAGRPAVIVSNNANNANSSVVEVCYCTLQDKTPLPTHVTIEKGPLVNSTVLCEQITSISVERLGDYMCRLSDDHMDKIDKALCISLGLPEPAKYIPGANVVLPEPSSLREEQLAQIEELKCAVDNFKAKAEALEAENRELIRECDKNEVYKDMYDKLLDRVLR